MFSAMRTMNATQIATFLLASLPLFPPLALGQENPPPANAGPMPDCCRMMQPGSGMGMMGMGGGMMPGRPGMGMRAVQDGLVQPGPRPVQRRGLAGAPPLPPMEMQDRDDLPARLLRRPEVQKELGLTDEQRKKLEDIAFSTEKTVIQSRAGLQILRMELGRLARAENPDRPAIDKKIQEIAQAEASLMRATVNAGLDARGVLTREQRDKLPNALRNPPPAPPAPVGPGPMRMRGGRQQPPQPKPPQP